jgi:hypothetical protein
VGSRSLRADALHKIYHILPGVRYNTQVKSAKEE